MAVGGNHRARNFFKQHGWDEVRQPTLCRAGRDASAGRCRRCRRVAPPQPPPTAGCAPPPCTDLAPARRRACTQVGSDKIEAKYTSRAAQLYRKQLEKDAAKLAGAGGEPGSPSFSPQQPGTSSLWGSIAAAPPAAAAAAPAAAAGAEPPASSSSAAHGTTAAAAARATTAGKPRLLASRKPGGKTGGLGVKKISAKVDDSLFEQAPQEDEPAPAPGADAAAPGSGGDDAPLAAPAAPTTSRFNMDTLEEKKPALQVGVVLAVELTAVRCRRFTIALAVPPRPSWHRPRLPRSAARTAT